MKFKLSLILLPFLPILLPACQPENKGNSSTNDNQVVQSTDVAEFEGSQVYKIDIQFCGNRDQILFADQDGCITAPTVYHWLKDKNNVEAILIKKQDFTDLKPGGQIHYSFGLNSQGCFSGNPIPNQQQLYSIAKTQVIVDPSVVGGGASDTWDQGIKIKVTEVSRETALQNSQPCNQIALNN